MTGCFCELPFWLAHQFLSLNTSCYNLTWGTSSGTVADVGAVLADLYLQWMRPSREHLYPVHELHISTLQGLSKGVRNTLFPNLFLPIQIAVTPTILFNYSIILWLYFMIIVVRIHTPLWSYFLEWICLKNFVCAWNCSFCWHIRYFLCLNKTLSSADWGFCGVKVVQKESKISRVVVTTEIWRCFDQRFLLNILSNV